MALASPNSCDLSYIDSLPAPESTTYFCTFVDMFAHASARVMIGEVLEKHERHREAIAYAQAELQEPGNRNAVSKIRAGRLLGKQTMQAGLNRARTRVISYVLQAVATQF